MSPVKSEPSWHSHGALFRSMLQPDLDSTLTASCILRADNTELWQLLPLALAALQRIGEEPKNRALFVELVDAMRARVSSCRAVKLRLLLLCKTPGYADFWQLRLVHRNEAYASAHASLQAKLAEHGVGYGSDDTEGSTLTGVSSDGVVVHGNSQLSNSGSLRESSSSSTSGKWITDKNELKRYAVEVLLHKEKGVRQRDNKRHLRIVRNSFHASELVDFIMEKANFADRKQAVAIGQILKEEKLITRVGHGHKDFDDTDKLYQSNVALHQADGEYACIKTANGEVVNCWKQLQADKNITGLRSVELKIPVDMIDLQSLDFWGESVFVKNPVKNQSLGFRVVSHPMVATKWSNSGPSISRELSSSTSDLERSDSSLSALTADASGVGSIADSIVHHGSSRDPMTTSSSSCASSHGIVSNAIVRKVFSSIARPMIIELRKAEEDTLLTADEDYSVSSPRIIVKEGDNLGQDMGVEIMFRAFNMIWEEADDLFTLGSQPLSVPYEVFPTSPKQGFMEAVSGLSSLKGYDWAAWKLEQGATEEGRRQMMRSAAGSYVGAYILGAADRHEDNVQIQDDFTMLHIDFGFLLGSTPPIDGPQFAIYPAMEKAFKDVGIWSDFVEMCGNAFIAVRRVAPAVIRSAVMLFSKVGFLESDIREFLSGMYSLNTHEKSEKAAKRLVTDMISHSSNMWKTKFKSYSHQNIDPAFYALLERRFPPAVLAMRIVDAKEQKASRKLSEGGSDNKAQEGDKVAI